LVHAVDAKNAGEAQLRFEVTRVSIGVEV
jgi:hypothetical protein